MIGCSRHYPLTAQNPHPSKTGLGGPPSITVSALSRDTCSRGGFVGFAFPFVEGFDFGVAFDVCSFGQGSRLRILQWNSVPLTIYPVSPLPIMIRCADSPTPRGGKAPNQPNDDLLLHQGGPRAALRANQLRITGLAAQHPVHAYRQLAGDRNLGHAAAPAQLQSLIVLP